MKWGEQFIELLSLNDIMWKEHPNFSNTIKKKNYLFYLTPPSVKNGESNSQPKLLLDIIHSSFIIHAFHKYAWIPYYVKDAVMGAGTQ